MAFSFGFEDDEADDAKTSPAGPSVLKAGKVQAHQAPVKEHTLEELVGKAARTIPPISAASL